MDRPRARNASNELDGFYMGNSHIDQGGLTLEGSGLMSRSASQDVAHREMSLLAFGDLDLEISGGIDVVRHIGGIVFYRMGDDLVGDVFV